MRKVFSSLRERGAVSTVNEFMRKPWYVLCLAALTVLCNALGLDLVLYSVFIALGVYISLLGVDYLPLVPVVILCYVAPSTQNNPGRYPNSVFYPQNGGIYLILLAVIFLISVVFRLVTDGELGGKTFFSQKRRLTGGIVLLSAAYLLSGVCSAGYGDVIWRNLLFAVVQCFAVGGMYFFFTGSIKWDRVPGDYLAWTGMSVGFVVMIQLLENYLSGRIFVGSTIDRELIATGWGMHNNVGGLIAMMMPFAFSLAAHHRRGWVFNILGTVLMLGTVMSCSRGSMLMAGCAYVLCAVILLKDKESRRVNLRLYVLMAVAVIVGVVLFFGKLLDIFELFLTQLGNISQRDNLIYYGIQQFLDEPVFGGSFFPRGEYVPWDWANLESFSSFFPPRWHNTLVQIAASCGTVGITAYAVHRFQTVKLFLKRRSTQNTFIAISLGVLLMASLLDCHFFNVGPVLFYSMALAFAEKSPV